MQLLRAALLGLFFLASDVLAAPVVPCCIDDGDRDRIDPLKSEDSFSADVNRAKRKSKAMELASNMILNALEQRRKRDQAALDASDYLPSGFTRQATRKVDRETPTVTKEEDEEVDETTPFGEGGKVTLQIPGRLFGNATNLFLAVAKMLGDFITNTAIRKARFMKLFQPLLGRNLYIQIPPSTTESNDV
ncbi:uncharacterized protein LOC131425268 [Malaya genurostris]|uniref:uncharacterized protein LOC131425268 n=1 Tax=Malaya genurostris TaxID=325434 RepID=UPI0026F3A06F|nr:uncharacterized protein LOC131425268 [Malaya genurostris]